MSVEIDQDSTPIKKYRLGSLDTEYELITTYTEWSPQGFVTWADWFDSQRKLLLLDSYTPETKVTIMQPHTKDKVTLLLDYAIIKDAFPQSFYREERAKNWSRFYIVSNEATPDIKFIIPLP